MTVSDYYNTADSEIAAEIESLYSELSLELSDFSHEAYTVHDVTRYGIYPNYSNQRVKILFVGREARGLSGQSYLETLFLAYRAGIVDGKRIDGHGFHRRLMKVLYAAANPELTFSEIPKAIEIAASFGESHGVSCAFLNLSKFSNEGDSWNTNWKLLKASNLEDTFFARFVAVTRPHLIISMNLYGTLSKLMESSKISDLPSSRLYHCSTGRWNCFLIDGYHYSAGISDEVDVVLPVQEFLRNYDFRIGDRSAH